MKKIFGLFLVLFSTSNIAEVEVIHINYDRLSNAPHSANAILRKDQGFVEDFLALHTLLRMAQAKSVFEIGTCTGEGTLIIKNAVSDAVVYSLDLPPGQSSYDIKQVGEACYLPYVQLRGNSSTFNYSAHYPIDAWFIDGAHDYVHVLGETKEALKSKPSIIIWHDADVPEVLEGIREGLEDSGFKLFRVTKTRIAFAVPQPSAILGMLNE